MCTNDDNFINSTTDTQILLLLLLATMERQNYLATNCSTGINCGIVIAAYGHVSECVLLCYC